jgi:hypothetical protein
MQKSAATALDHHLRLLRDISPLSPWLLDDDSFLVLMANVTLPAPVPVSHLLPDASLDLTAISDTVSMIRQEQVHITRKLRSVKEAWAERKDEWELLERTMIWLAEHDSFDRRAKGSCAEEVYKVVRGFDEVLGGMERQLFEPRFATD